MAETLYQVCWRWKSKPEKGIRVIYPPMLKDLAEKKAADLNAEYPMIEHWSEECPPNA